MATISYGVNLNVRFYFDCLIFFLLYLRRLRHNLKKRMQNNILVELTIQTSIGPNLIFDKNRTSFFIRP